MFLKSRWRNLTIVLVHHRDELFTNVVDNFSWFQNTGLRPEAHDPPFNFGSIQKFELGAQVAVGLASQVLAGVQTTFFNEAGDFAAELHNDALGRVLGAKHAER